MSAACAVWELWVELAKVRGWICGVLRGVRAWIQGVRVGDCKGVERGVDGGVVRAV